MPELHLLTGAYALDALEGVERAGFERHLRGCETCTEEVAEFREAATKLAERVVQAPPPELRDRVLAEVAMTRQASPGRPALPRFSMRRTLSIAAAAVLVAAGAGLGGVSWQAHQEAASARTEAAGIAQVMNDPARLDVQGKPSVGGSATVMSAGASAIFAAYHLPAPPSGKAYQLWLIKDPKHTVSVGLLSLHGGNAQSVVTGVTPGAKVAVSVEPAGGSKQPTTTPILALTVA